MIKGFWEEGWTASRPRVKWQERGILDFHLDFGAVLAFSLEGNNIKVPKNLITQKSERKTLKI